MPLGAPAARKRPLRLLLHALISGLADAVGEDLALGLADLLLLANVLQDEVHMILRRDRSRKGLISHLLGDLLLPKGYRVKHTLHFLLLRPSNWWVTTPRVVRIFYVSLNEPNDELSLLVSLGRGGTHLKLFERVATLHNGRGATCRSCNPASDQHR